MKKIFTLLPFTIMAFCVLVSGCVAADESPVSTSLLPTYESLPTLTITATLSPSPIMTQTAFFPTPTIASTPLPTLTAEKRLNFTKELFRTNGNCKLPCWWGVIPGEATWPEVEVFLEYVGARTGSQLLNDGSVYHGTGGFDFDLPEGIIANRVGFLERAGVIELITIYSEGYSNPKAFQEQWAAYSPNLLIKEYGVPSRVWLESISSGPVTEHRIAGYTLWVFYDHLGFLVLYEGYGEYEPIYHFCPRFENGEDIRFIEMYLQSPDNPNPIEVTTGIIGLEIAPYPRVQSIKDATGINITEFYNLFVQEDIQACFDTPRDIWP